MAAYWDTACVLKLYCQESDSGLYLAKVSSSKQPVTSSILAASELIYAFHQKEARRELAQGAANILFDKFLTDVRLGRFQLLPFGEDVQAEARRIASLCYSASPPILLRTLDGLHLASARLAGCQEILTTDARMRSAATLLGIDTIN